MKELIKAIQKANPSLMELSFGCEVYVDENFARNTIVSKVIETSNNKKEICLHNMGWKNVDSIYKITGLTLITFW